jgi:regulator of protease activity HflC (stomatin/prohibitin superfamily)
MSLINANVIAVALLAILILGIAASAIRVLREYERGVVFTLGRFSGLKGPGIIILIPIVQQMVRVDLRTIVLDVPTQDVISHDNVSVKVNAVIYFRVVDPDKAVIQVQDYMEATSQLAQTTLRSVLGKHDLDEMLSERDKLNSDLQAILDVQTDAWGIKVATVEIKHVDIDESMVRAIARQAEAERNRRARIIDAEGEQQAAEKLVEAATILGRAPWRDATALLVHVAWHCERTQLHHPVPHADRSPERAGEGRRSGSLRSALRMTSCERL